MANYNNSELNNLMTQNLSLLSLCSFDQYNNILSENQSLKLANSNLIIKHNELMINNNKLVDYKKYSTLLSIIR